MEAYTLDQTDIKLLQLLQQDGLMTYKDLSRATNRSYNPIFERVARLRQLGYIQKTVAIVDIHKVQSVFTAFPMIQLKSHTDEAFNRFQQTVAQHPQIMECHHVMGQYDFILKVIVSDAMAYNEFLRRHISTLQDVLRVESFPMLAAVKHETAHQLIPGKNSK